ncbi:rhomboid family intramembrane serine protease [Nocardioides panacisoli]|uniref:rhomboid family intramembrane serine protease n=1 Tax=Nocardioides panacisoli TaxID=627624 RepID=UPI0031D04713
MPTCYRHPERETYISCQRCGRAICPDCMNDAAVGFQCPDCLAEGRKQTRSGRTAYGGLRPSRPGIVSMTLIGINAVVWLAIVASGGASSRLFELIGLLPEGRCQTDNGGWFPGIGDASTCDAINRGAHWVNGVADGAVWQLLTSTFSHIEVWHIGFNMLALWVLGPQLEIALGRARFLVLYLGSSLAGSVCVLWLSSENQVTLGASGAIFGLMGALLVIARKVHADMSGLLGWIGANALLTFIVPNVSWQGHVGGFVGGLLIAGILVYAPKARRTLVQSAGVAAVVVALLAATAVRMAMLG